MHNLFLEFFGEMCICESEKWLYEKGLFFFEATNNSKIFFCQWQLPHCNALKKMTLFNKKSQVRKFALFNFLDNKKKKVAQDINERQLTQFYLI